MRYTLSFLDLLLIYGSGILTYFITVSIIHKEIKDSIKISKSKLTLTLIDLGYTYKKIGDNRRVMYD